MDCFLRIKNWLLGKSPSAPPAGVTPTPLQSAPAVMVIWPSNLRRPIPRHEAWGVWGQWVGQTLLLEAGHYALLLNAEAGAGVAAGMVTLKVCPVVELGVKAGFQADKGWLGVAWTSSDEVTAGLRALVGEELVLEDPDTLTNAVARDRPLGFREATTSKGWVTVLQAWQALRADDMRQASALVHKVGPFPAMLGYGRALTSARMLETLSHQENWEQWPVWFYRFARWYSLEAQQAGLPRP